MTDDGHGPGQANGVGELPHPVGVPGKSSLRLRQTGGASDTGECRDIHTHTHSDQLLERAGVGRSTEPPTVQEQHPLPEAADPVPGDPAVDAHRPPPQTGARWLRPNVRVHTFHHTTIARMRPGPPGLHLVTKVPFFYPVCSRRCLHAALQAAAKVVIVVGKAVATSPADQRAATRTTTSLRRRNGMVHGGS